MGTENKYCYPNVAHDWSSLADAEVNCSSNSDCSMFFDNCGVGEYRSCSADATIGTSGCSSMLYEKRNF